MLGNRIVSEVMMAKKQNTLINTLFVMAFCLGFPYVLWAYIGNAERDHQMYIKLVSLCIVLLLAWKKNLIKKDFKVSYYEKCLFIELILFALILCHLLPFDLILLSLPISVLCVTFCNLRMGLLAKCILAVVIGSFVIILGWLRNYEQIFGKPGFDTYLAVFQTNLDEASNYVQNYLDPYILWLSFLFMLWVIFFRNVLFPKHGISCRWQVMVSGYVILVLGLYLTEEALEARWNVFAASYSKYKTEISHQDRLLKDLYLNSDSNQPIDFQFVGNFIFILGESTTRRHMSIYGYHRETTPNLTLLKEQLLIHNDTVSSHSYTTRAVPAMFNLGSFDKAGINPEFSMDLLTAMKLGGFETWWLSNQSEYGLHDNLMAVYAKNADYFRFNRKAFLSTSLGDAYDHKLLPFVKEALANKESKKSIFLHLFATRTPYCAGIPKEFRNVLSSANGLQSKFFGGYDNRSDEVNCYDNAVRYVDYIVSSVIDLATIEKNPTIVLYLPDHGENPVDGTFHNSARHSAYHVEIPHLWYFNSAAQEVLADYTGNFRKNAEQPFITRDLFHTLMNLLGAETKTYDSRRSLFSSQYLPSQRLILCEDTGCTDYDDANLVGHKDALEMTRAALINLKREDRATYQKIWAHRVNSIGKLLEAKQCFSGVEADVVFMPITGRFHVFHPPATDLGLDLGQYLEAMKDQPELRLWIDWKNADVDTFGAALEQLCELDRVYGLKHRTIIETTHDSVFVALTQLGALGFQHSYYVPTDAVRKCLADGEQAGCETLSETIFKNAKTVGARYLSYVIDNEPFFDKFTKRFEGFGKLTWNLNVPVRDESFGKKLGDVSKYDIYLVKFDSLFDI